MKNKSGMSQGLPLEVHGWFLLNALVRLDRSDTATVLGRTEDYKVETVWKALYQKFRRRVADS